MQQLDLFNSHPTDQIYSELQKHKHSTSKCIRAIFSLLTEVQDELIKLKQEREEI